MVYIANFVLKQHRILFVYMKIEAKNVRSGTFQLGMNGVLSKLHKNGPSRLPEFQTTFII